MSFEKFKTAFEEDEKLRGSVFELVYATPAPFNGKIVDEQMENQYDSYGNENSTLYRVYYFEDFGIYVRFEGYRASHYGEEWKDNYREVKPITKSIVKYE